MMVETALEYDNYGGGKIDKLLSKNGINSLRAGRGNSKTNCGTNYYIEWTFDLFL